jgi:hypothetical protein
LLTEIKSLVTHIAVGDDDTTPTEGDTTLGNETFRDTATVTQSGLTLTVKGLLDVTENNGNTVKELGLFDAAASGNMYSRNLTTVVDKDGNTEIRLTNTLTVSTENADL